MPEQIILTYKENCYVINLQQLELKFDVKTAVDEAYEIGRTQNVVRDLWDYAKIINNNINIDCNIHYRDDILEQYIKKIADQLPDKVEEYTYYIEDDKLIINRGKKRSRSKL